MQDKLKVFLSSEQSEFEKDRIIIAKQISRIPFLSCKPLETTGASPIDVEEASILGARTCDIYVGIFGTSYSVLVTKEYNEAINKFKPPFIYVKKIEATKRDNKLDRFLNNRVKPNFKMHFFTSNTDLRRKINDNLTEHVLDLLRDGLKQYASTKREAKRKTIAERKKAQKAITTGQEDLPEKIVQQAKSSFRQEDYLSCVIKCSIALESWLRLELNRKGFSQTEIGKSPLPRLIQQAIDLQILSRQDSHMLTEIRILRNRSLHEGRFPSKIDARFALNTVTKIVKG